METTAPSPTIVEQVAQFINRYVVLPDADALLVLALWVIHTHVFENAYATPYIYINSHEPGCGKTRLLEVLEYAARNAALSASLTSSTLYRQMIDPEYRPTMLIDEVDALFDGSKKNEDMRGVLNSGYQHKGYVLRTLPGKGEDDVVRMPTFCPKVLAGIDNGELPPTLKSRSLTITLRKKAPNQITERFLPRRVEPIAEELRAAIVDWAADNADIIDQYEPDFVDGIDDRQFQITEPLLQVAHAAGLEVAARQAIVRICEEPLPPMTTLQRILFAAREHFATSGEDRVSSNHLMVQCDLTGKMVSTILVDNGAKPMTLNKYAEGKNVKGFYRRDLQPLIDAQLQGR